MSKRAEEAALKAYPQGPDEFHMCVGIETIRWMERRLGYQEGFEQAEKDLALTGDDIKFIIDKYSELPIQYGPRLFEEILKQFNEQREKK